MDRHAEGFEQRPVLGRQRRWQRVEQVDRPRHQLAHPSVDRTVTGEANLRAQMAEVAPACVTRAARDRRIDGDHLPVQRSTFDGSGDLVTEHQRSRQRTVADAALAEPVEVRSADPDRIDTDQGFARPRLRRCLQVGADIAWAV